MIRITAVLSLTALLAPGAILAAPDHSKKPKVVHVYTCPIKQTAANKAIKASMVKTKSATYMVHFCCGDCPLKFDKLSAAAKEKKIKAVLGKKAAATPAPAHAPKMVEVNTCPIMGGSSAGAGGGTSMVGNYKVNFCCGGCKPKFDSLTQAEKDAKIKSALKGS